MSATPLDKLTAEQLAGRVSRAVDKLEAYAQSRHKLIKPDRKLPPKLQLARIDLMNCLQEQLRRTKLFHTCMTRDCPELGSEFIWYSDGAQDPRFQHGKPCWFCADHAPQLLQPDQFNKDQPLMLWPEDYAALNDPQGIDAEVDAVLLDIARMQQQMGVRP